MNAILRDKTQHRLGQGSQIEIAPWGKLGPTE